MRCLARLLLANYRCAIDHVAARKPASSNSDSELSTSFECRRRSVRRPGLPETGQLCFASHSRSAPNRLKHTDGRGRFCEGGFRSAYPQRVRVAAEAIFAICRSTEKRRFRKFAQKRLVDELSVVRRCPAGRERGERDLILCPADALAKQPRVPEISLFLQPVGSSL